MFPLKNLAREELSHNLLDRNQIQMYMHNINTEKTNQQTKSRCYKWDGKHFSSN